jgi:septal ring factor EnvC (AmiA/AmiB activator)
MTERASGSFVARATDNLWLTFAGRAAMIACALMMPIAGWVADQAWRAYEQRQDRVEHKLDSISQKINDQNINFATLNERVNQQNERVGRLEGDVEGLKRRVYAYPTAQDYPEPPEQKARQKWEK